MGPQSLSLNIEPASHDAMQDDYNGRLLKSKFTEKEALKEGNELLRLGWVRDTFWAA